ncbi:MAG TPA: hypothetical protein VGK67_02140 [Myxococcales bacterium]|jgi:hypothetical protein
MTDTKTPNRYPEAATLQIELERPKQGPYGPTETLKFDRDHPEWVRCTNPACNSGKFLLNSPVAKAVSSRKTELSTELKCNGVEKNRAGGRGQTCMTRAKLTVRASYKA